MKLLVIILALSTIGKGDSKIVHLNNFGLYWRNWDVNTKIPHDAVRGGVGEDGHETYIARSVDPKLGIIVPGKACPVENKMWYEFENVEHERTQDVQVLCALNAQRLKWVYAKFGDKIKKIVQENVLVIGGHDKTKSLAIGRHIIGNEVQIGKVIVDEKKGTFLDMKMTQSGKGWGINKGYQVLVYINKTEPSDFDTIKLEVG